MLEFGFVQLSWICIEFGPVCRHINWVDPWVRFGNLFNTHRTRFDANTHPTGNVDGSLPWRRRCNHIRNGLWHKLFKYPSTVIARLFGCKRWKESCFHYSRIKIIGRHNQCVSSQRYAWLGACTEESHCKWATKEPIAMEKNNDCGRRCVQYGRFNC